MASTAAAPSSARAIGLVGTRVQSDDLGLSATHEPLIHSTGLSRKLTCSVAVVVFIGVIAILLLQVGLVLSAVPNWGADAKDTMIEIELANILKLASDKAQYVTEIFERVEEGVLQLQAFAEQVLLETPKTMQVDSYLASYSGLEPTTTGEPTWDYSTW